MIIFLKLFRNNVLFILVGSVVLSDFLIGVYGVVIVKNNLFSGLYYVKLCVIMDNDILICMYMGMIFIVG